MSSIIEGGLAKWPVYRDEAAHLAAGEGPGVDLCDSFGIGWTAPVDCVVVSGTGSDPDKDDGVFHAGYVTVLSGTLNGENYLLHFCHGQANEVKPGDQLTAGKVFGHVGYSGTCIPSGQGGAHLHFWAQRWGANGWERVTDVQGLLAEIEGEDTMSEQDKAVIADAVAYFKNDLVSADPGPTWLRRVQELVEQASTEASNGGNPVPTLNAITPIINTIYTEAALKVDALEGLL